MLARSIFLVLLLVALVARAAESPSRPNILWVVSEDNSYNFVGAFGDPLARTPHLDALARDGVVFTHAYAAAPVCAPSRSSIITGRMANGMGSQHMRSTPPLPEGVKFFPEFLRAAGYHCTNNAKTDYNTSTPFAAAWNASGRNAHWRQRAPGQPFFAVFNHEHSHESRLHTREKLLTDPAKVRVPPYLPDTPTVRADIAQYYDCVSRADAAIGEILAQLAADGLAEDTIVFYYSDHGGATPRSKRFLYENGTHSPLIVRFPKKFAHLAPSAAGSRVGELVSLVDLAPTVLSLAGLPRPAQFEGRAFAGTQRTPAPAFVAMFRDRMDERYDFSRAVTDGRWRYIRNYLPHLPAGQPLAYLWKQASMREWHELHRAGKLNAVQNAFFQPRAAEELYDCEADPDNVRNLAAEPAHQAKLERLRAAHREHSLRVRDTGFLPEALMRSLAAGASPTVVCADEARYPLARIMARIDALQLPATPPVALVASTLRDPVPVMRYWGVIAAHRLSPDALDLTPSLADADPSVRIAAAEVILLHRPNPAAERVLQEALEPQQTASLRLAALNVLARLPKMPAAFAAVVKAAAAELPVPGTNENYVARAAEALVVPAP